MLARKEVLVQLSDELVAALDAEAGRSGTSRSAVLRDAAVEFLKHRDREEISRQIVESYTRLPQSATDADEWGDLAAQQEASFLETSRMLDREDGPFPQESAG